MNSDIKGFDFEERENIIQEILTLNKSVLGMNEVILKMISVLVISKNDDIRIV